MKWFFRNLFIVQIIKLRNYHLPEARFFHFSGKKGKRTESSLLDLLLELASGLHRTKHRLCAFFLIFLLECWNRTQPRFRKVVILWIRWCRMSRRTTLPTITHHHQKQSDSCNETNCRFPKCISESWLSAYVSFRHVSIKCYYTHIHEHRISAK